MSTSENSDHTTNVVARGTLTFPSRLPAEPVEEPTMPSAPIDSLDVTGLDLAAIDAETEPEPFAVLPRLTFTKSGSRSVATPVLDAERKAEYFSLNLPSGFAFYPFKTLSVTLVKGLQQSKFSRAAKESNLRYTVEAISSCLGDGVSAGDLAIQDFFYVMYWLRLASYTKFDFTHVAVCNNAKHVEDVIKGAKDARTLTSIHVVKNTQLEESMLDVEAINALSFPTLAEEGLQLGYASMRDSVTFSEEFEPTDPSYADSQYQCDLASVLHPSHGTLQERMARVRALSGDALRELEAYQNAQSRFGVKESVVVTCKECGSAIRTTLSVAAHSFF